MKLKVMSYNVLHFEDDRTGKPAAAAYAEVIRRSGADIVGINESYDETRTSFYGPQAKTVAEELGWHWYFAEAIVLNEEGPYGNSILSRYPLKEMRSVLVPDPAPRKYDGYYETRCVLCCTADVDGTPVSLAVTHFGLNPDEQENAVRTVLEETKAERFILMGDLNVKPEAPVLLPLRARLTDTAEALGALQTSFPAAAPDRRIDYIFVSKDIRVLGADIPAVILSDHRPYTAELEIGG
ncbi:MAG: endonuclease/exonuclease/phosphatase family protein [Clostridia bacterium]|nr:endonuclease/exonuclease/phosphatase family protein [Clostridia bacterium]